MAWPKVIIVWIALCVSQVCAMGPEMIGKPAPIFTLRTVDGSSSLSLKDLRGRVVVIDFWASWCSPCRKSLPRLAELETHEQRVKVLAVNVDDQRINAVEFLKRNKLKITSVYDANKDVAGNYDIPAMPSALIVDKSGIVRFVHPGYSEKDLDTIKREVESLL
jgi:cytochrome c biogenesis protein CcmG/thiol:disulfide interchange protein DsbE